jgi:TRAP-type C4-dicarboxylate transport system substrate-binding protein
VDGRARILTLSYQSTSYLADRVPELEFADLPFLFDSLEHARAAMDGKLGAYLSRKIEERIPGYRVSATSRTATATSPTGCIPCARWRT